ncbi:MAG: cupin [Novosphingobium sp.]|jgi:mannose-6-phosphate isomerase-like protein (cupin superfamily)|uniref:cupin n=1 Tax=Novosphingobium sp. TaxID=1874826 RepID=UPI00391C17BA|nr:cupin domain-containing protein [Novosphingobium sp.]
MVDFVTGTAVFRSLEPWQGETLGKIGSSDVYLLYADSSYTWHTNKTDELFCVLEGCVDMDVRDAAGERRVRLERGEFAMIRAGEEHVAHPIGEARILIVAGG